MTPDTTILNELKNIAPTLATASRQMPFEVPAGYFEQLADSMLAQVNVTAVPSGYFDNFADNMLALVRQQEAQQELTNVAPTVAGLSRQMPYSVPAGYFDSLQPMAATAAHELQEIAPTLAAMPKQMPYGVPAGYFDQLQPAIPATVGKVVSITRKAIVRIAIAAAILIVGFSIWQMSVTDNSANNDSMATTTVDTVVIPQEFSLQLANLDDNTLESAFSAIGQSSSQTEAAYLLETDNFEAALQTISTEAISEQLQQHPVTQKNI